MEVYAKILRFKRSGRRKQHLLTLFEEIWTATGTFATAGAEPKWHFTPPVSFLPYHLAIEVPRVHFNALPLQTPSPADSSLGEAEDLDAAIDLLFLDVQQSSTGVRHRDDDPNPTNIQEEPLPPSPATLIRMHCRGQYYLQNLIRDSSPDTTQRIQTFLQEEIDAILREVEDERQKAQRLQLTNEEQAEAH